MSKAKIILLSLLALCAFGATTATSAHATSPEWWVNGSVIEEDEKLAAKATVTTPFIISTAAFSLRCKEITVNNGFIRVGNLNNSIESLSFEACDIPAMPACTVANFKSKPLVFKLENPEKKEGKIILNFLPKSSSLLAEFPITGTGCSAAGNKELKSGASKGMICTYPGVETEKVEHELNFGEKSGTEITINGAPATFTGVMQYKLASGSEWSAR